LSTKNATLMDVVVDEENLAIIAIGRGTVANVRLAWKRPAGASTS
jgi:hypothetical protein